VSNGPSAETCAAENDRGFYPFDHAIQEFTYSTRTLQVEALSPNIVPLVNPTLTYNAPNGNAVLTTGFTSTSVLTFTPFVTKTTIIYTWVVSNVNLITNIDFGSPQRTVTLTLVTNNLKVKMRTYAKRGGYNPTALFAPPVKSTPVTPSPTPAPTLGPPLPPPAPSPTAPPTSCWGARTHRPSLPMKPRAWH